MRKKLIAGNWKMNKTPKQAAELCADFSRKINHPSADVVFCVPSVDLSIAVETLKNTNIAVGAQNLHFEESGAFTGEISAEMLTELGIKYVIIGHSERREYFAETNETVNKKVVQALKHNIIPIICCGETLEQRDQGITVDLVRLQIKIAYKGVKESDALNTVVAYEPIWAIGTGRVATTAQAEEVCAAIRNVIAEIYSKETADKIRVLYGGSVNGGNAAELFAMPNIDGGLVGGASLKPEFADICGCAK